MSNFSSTAEEAEKVHSSADAGTIISKLAANDAKAGIPWQQTIVDLALSLFMLLILL